MGSPQRHASEQVPTVHYSSAIFDEGTLLQPLHSWRREETAGIRSQ